MSESVQEKDEENIKRMNSKFQIPPSYIISFLYIYIHLFIQ